MSERPLVFRCNDSDLVGVLNVPDQPQHLGVIVIVGGPQYRAGSHRQFVSLARALEAGGFACLRFDYRGMGDSAVPKREFDAIDDDIRAAVDALLGAVPELDGVVLWGLCDGASAAFIYAAADNRVQGIVALNPWVRTEASLAAARINHYYKGQVLSFSFWKRVLSGDVAIGRSLIDLAGAVRDRLKTNKGDGHPATAPARSFIERMGDGWHRMESRTLVVLSGNDLTAREFADFCRTQPAWREATQRGRSCVEIVDADHTFSRRDWKHAVEQATLDWLRGRISSSVTKHQRSA